MKRYAIIEQGKVVNVALAEQEFAVSVGWVEAPDEVSIGFLFENGVFTPPVLTPPDLSASSVSMRQARLALLSVGLLDDVENAIDSIPDVTLRRAAQIEWEYATEVRKDSQLIQSLGPSLGLTKTQIDDLFHQASLIK